jgi:Leucine-rich repeat (LRR) protein
LPALASVTALQKLKLRHCLWIKQLPPLKSLVQLQKLDLSDCQQLRQLPALENLTALQTFILNRCQRLQHLPPMDTITALKVLDISSFQQQNEEMRTSNMLITVRAAIFYLTPVTNKFNPIYTILINALNSVFI